MKVIGFEIKKGELRFSVLEGAVDAPVWVTHGRRVFNAESPRTDLMSWFKQNFLEIVTACSPEKISYRVSLNAKTVAQNAYLLFPWGILNLIAFEKSIPICEFNKMTFTAKRFGLPKGVKPDEQLDVLFGARPPHWDDAQKISVLAAWAGLSD